jgi:hypothetical protein
MSGEVDPYAPPSVDPARPSSASQDGGKLWRVVDDRLQVRNMASLPDVCVYGYPEEEPGTRVFLVLQTLPNWVVQLSWLAVVATVFWEGLGWQWMFAIVLSALILPGLLSKKVRLMVFRSQRAVRLSILRGILFPVVMGVAVYGALSYESRWEWLPSGLHAGVAVGAVLFLGFLLNLIPRKGPARAVALKDGWFEVKGTAPEAVRRLEEIQQRASTVHRPA